MDNLKLKIGVINPYALVEVVLQKKVDWKRVNAPELMEKVLKVPYAKLFDPIHPESPLFESSTSTLDFKSLKMVSKISLPKSEPKDDHWKDVGDFFLEYTEFDDPIQGAVADCYFIAALAAVAWARPYVIAHRNRNTGTGTQSFVDVVEFWKDGNRTHVEVDETLPVQSANSNNLKYARSNDVGEIWPGIYEKAYTKWRTNKDPPYIPDIAYGDCVLALEEITGLPRTYWFNKDYTASQIYSLIQSNCMSKKTINPMTCWTYGSSKDTPDKVVYEDSNIVASHCYTILGWEALNGKKYIVLRNPWGITEPTSNVVGGQWVCYDAPYVASGTIKSKGSLGWWRPVELSPNDGVFALEVGQFKKYYGGFGRVK